MRLIIIAAVLVVVAIFGYRKIMFALHHESTDNAQVETQLVPVLPRVPGYVKSIAVNDYDSVKAGQLVVELDDADIQAQLVQLNADYAAAVADLQNAKAALNNAPHFTPREQRQYLHQPGETGESAERPAT